MRLRTAILASALVLATGSALVIGQQQAAEAPASSRPAMTRPAVAGRNGLVTTGHPIASSAGLQILIRAATPSTPPPPSAPWRRSASLR